MKRLYSILIPALFIALSIQPASAVKARPDIKHTYIQPDGTQVEFMLVGDEHFHYYVDADGNPMISDETGHLRVVTADRLEQSFRIKTRTVGSNHLVSTTDVDNNEPWRGLGLFGEQFPHFGSPHALVILVQYSDVKFSIENPNEYFNRFLNENGFSDNGATGSVGDYFRMVSSGQFTPVFDVYGPVTIDKRATYGANDIFGDDINPGGMIVDACEGLNNAIDFSKYDNDGDGYVDNVYVIYAGEGEASYGTPDTIWPHQWTLSEAGTSLMLDGVTVENYGCCNELDNGVVAGIGTFCHEFGHVIGLPDLYSYSSVRSNYIVTPGKWDVMDEGNYNNDNRTPPAYTAFERNALGWIDLEVLRDGMSVELPDLRTSNKAYVVPVESNRNEFFIFENRQQQDCDQFLPGHGMLIWHINYNKNVWSNNAVNETASKQYVDIEEANGIANNYSYSTMAGYPFPGTSGNTIFSDFTTPNMLSWNKKPSNLVIYNITEDNHVVRFSVSTPSGVNSVKINTDDIAEYYTITGQKIVGTPTPGIYIRRNGANIEKVVIK